MEKAKLQQLAVRAASGESEAWTALYNEVSKIAAYVCSKNGLSPEDAEDVTQETTLAISNRLKELAFMENPEGYIRRVVNSKSIDIIRSEAKAPVERMHENEDYVLNLPDASATPENEVAGFSANRLIDDFIAELPKDQRAALIMRYSQGYTNAQIAKKLNIPSGTVASRVRYGKIALQKRIERYEKENKIRLHAKIAMPFLPWRIFRQKTLQTAEIFATDGGSSISGGARAVTGLLASVVLCGAVIGTGFVLQGNNTPTAKETAPVQAVTEQTEPTAATVYEDIYETQVETVYTPVNIVQNEVNQQTAQTQPGLPDEFIFSGNRYEPSENSLTSKTYHSDTLGATLTFPDSWVNNVEILEYNFYISVIDKGLDIEWQNSIIDIYIDQNIKIDEIRDDFVPTCNILSFKCGYSGLPGKDNYCEYYCYMSWNQSVLYRTNLDYSNINREVLSVLESFRSDNSEYTSLLTQQKKNAVIKYKGSVPLQVP